MQMRAEAQGERCMLGQQTRLVSVSVEQYFPPEKHRTAVPVDDSQSPLGILFEVQQALAPGLPPNGYVEIKGAIVPGYEDSADPPVVPLSCDRLGFRIR
jgi:hypothetical protein